MKSSKCFLFIVTVFASLDLTAQVNKSKDSTVSFRVSGACEICKERIEKALKIKGVRSADWNVDSKMLTLVYSPTIVSLLKVHKIIAGVGHDTELEKAKDAVYNELPECCHYRKKEVIENTFQAANAVEHIGKIKGVVLEEDKKGSFKPLSGASVTWLGTNKGTFTDSPGIFFIPQDE